MNPRLPLLAACLGLAPAALADTAAALRPLQPALDALQPARIGAHVAVLASDEYEGRAPATPGEDRTVAYLADELRRLGLQPGNPDGSYFQEVPMVGITSQTSATVMVGDQALPLEPVNDMVALSLHTRPTVEVRDSEVVFVGYGIVAPEYGWDDYKGVDVRGKTVVMLVNDPPLLDPRDPSRLDDSQFRGRAMTYYGRWTYKYEIASEKGAAACIIVHETGPAGYPWAVVVGSWGRENFTLRQADGNAGRVAVEGWVTLEAARRLFAAAGRDFAALKAAAVSRDFRPVPLSARASFTVANTLRNVTSRNVLALLPGSDPRGRDEYVIFSAHWDHLGRDERRSGDQIFNGALDNASGTAVLLEIAGALKALPVAPRRSTLFAFVTAEEKGLLGSRYLAQNPLYPPGKTLANLNIDGANPRGLVSDVEVIGYGSTTIDELAHAVAAAEGRQLVPDTSPEKGFFYRSDHFEFARAGIPAFYPKPGKTYVGRPAGWGREQADLYTAMDYHKVTDEIKPDWTYDGMVQDAAFLMKVGWLILQGDTWPEWKPGAEFKARRDATLGK